MMWEKSSTRALQHCLAGTGSLLGTVTSSTSAQFRRAKSIGVGDRSERKGCRHKGKEQKGVS
jgi:hypothetical protein